MLVGRASYRDAACYTAEGHAIGSLSGYSLETHGIGESLSGYSLVQIPSCVSSVSSFLHSRRRLYQKGTAACIKCHQLLPVRRQGHFFLFYECLQEAGKVFSLCPLSTSLSLSLSLSASLSRERKRRQRHQCQRLQCRRHQCQRNQCLWLICLYMVHFFFRKASVKHE